MKTVKFFKDVAPAAICAMGLFLFSLVPMKANASDGVESNTQQGVEYSRCGKKWSFHCNNTETPEVRKSAPSAQVGYQRCSRAWRFTCPSGHSTVKSEEFEKEVNDKENDGASYGRCGRYWRFGC